MRKKITSAYVVIDKIIFLMFIFSYLLPASNFFYAASDFFLSFLKFLQIRFLNVSSKLFPNFFFGIFSALSHFSFRTRHNTGNILKMENGNITLVCG